ncbi:MULTISPECIES: hypothetical protein [unclassified Phaeobacter]|uniref:hypothetical protein n=1 Tax=unclassified Phaeobacter TaxID=2621772 RepID=UPI003A86F5B3
MAYDKTDPRSALRTKAAAKPRTGLVAIPQIGEFDKIDPAVRSSDGLTWCLRGQNFVVMRTEAEPGGSFTRQNQCDEYVVLLPENGATITVGGNSCDVPGNSIAFVPPADSAVILPEGGRFFRLFTSRSKDLVALCTNGDAYQSLRSHIPPLQDWPKPTDGWQLRHYSLDVPPEPGRFGRIFRCTTFMVNVLDPYDGPRDTTKMSPHHHDDFEQCSLVLEGAFSHHLRWPWTTDMADWRPDQEVKVGAPSVTVIPPPVIHTSRATGADRNAMVDVFCPPREDFSLKPGWVLNAADYPMAG